MTAPGLHNIFCCRMLVLEDIKGMVTAKWMQMHYSLSVHIKMASWPLLNYKLLELLSVLLSQLINSHSPSYYCSLGKLAVGNIHEKKVHGKKFSS